MKVLFSDLIHGQTPIDDFSGLKIRGISTQAELSEHESLNIGNVLVDYFGKASLKKVPEFNMAWAKSLHGEMYCDVWEWAGQFRRRDLTIGVPFQQIQEGLYNLFEDLRFWNLAPGTTITECAVRIHHRAVQIHPFQNGNGRWARMVANIWLRDMGQPLTAWPESVIGAVSTIRDRYLSALQAADRGEYTFLIQMHEELATRS